jgi:hypothetical protein
MQRQDKIVGRHSQSHVHLERIQHHEPRGLVSQFDEGANVAPSQRAIGGQHGVQGHCVGHCQLVRPVEMQRLQ